MDVSRVLDTMLRNTPEMGGESSERDTACAISTCISADLPASRPRRGFVHVPAMAIHSWILSIIRPNPQPSQADF